jgi:hypothetical protein
MEKDQSLGSGEVGAGRSGLLERAAAASAPRLRRRPGSTYDRVTRSIGLVVALLLMLALWVTGGYLTLTWLASMGVRLADAGLTPVAWLLRLPVPHQTASHWLWGVLAWCIPAAISGAEIGLWPRRVAHPLLWLIWGAFLCFDAWTTAAGMVVLIATDPTTAWLIGLATGAALALLPEKSARVIWALLREA